MDAYFGAAVFGDLPRARTPVFCRIAVMQE
jgi:hypothetical protein